jgi:hypothetical protein
LSNFCSFEVFNIIVHYQTEVELLLLWQYESERDQGGIVNFNLLDYRGEYVGFATFKRHIPHNLSSEVNREVHICWWPMVMAMQKTVRALQANHKDYQLQGCK